VVVMFINSDCSAGGHKGYTYVDDVCDECENVNEGDIDLNLNDEDCLSFPQSITGDFVLPASGNVSNVNITLEIYQSNSLVNTVTGPSISAPNFTFTLSPSDFPDQSVGQCYDLVAVLTFDIVDATGGVVTVTQKSSKEVGGIQDGERPGINNDVCFCDEQPTNEGAYCCDDENLVANGNFEAGNIGFSSSYIQTASTFPGEYDVTNSAGAFGATVTDHSFCADPVMYASNDLFMVVNGSTQQSSTAVVWQQTLTGLEQGERYKFCANFKNMPQCTFDILPQVFLNAGTSSSGAQTINTVASDPCDWQTVDITFTATGSSQNIQILLDEGGNGDGNDVAIDDIYVGKLSDPDLQITVQHDGTNNQITGSLNTIANTDDTLHGSDCEYYWYVAESSGFPVSVVWSTFAYGNTSGSMLPPFASIPGPAWNLTTTFPGYTFVDDKLYVIGMYTPECGCYGSGFTYQLTYNGLNGGGMSEETQEAIIDAILNGLDGDIMEGSVEEIVPNTLSLFPNPVEDLFTVQLLSDTLSEVEVLDISGKKVIGERWSGDRSTETINAASLPSGVYFVRIKGSNNQIHRTKLIKR
nr:T9SS type A sorting domain-containing protein [Bacteroidota bacterium]